MSEHPPSLTQRFAEFSLALTHQDLGHDVRAAAKTAILDTLGVALAGSREESTRALRKTFETLNDSCGATVLGADMRLFPTMAALINGHAAQALDYDDTQHKPVTHMSAPVVAAALAATETMHGTGKDLLTAYVTGFEVGCRLARVCRFGRHLSRRGIHATGLLGHFGATAAAGKLMKLDVPQMEHAFGIAASQAAGLMRSFGTMCKPLHAGNAAHNALFSVLLAKQGFTGPDNILDGEHSIFAIHDGRTDAEELLRGIGEQFEITANTIKAYACTGWRNPIVEALVQIATAHDLSPRDVEKIQVWVHEEMLQLPNFPAPQTGLEAKFSAQYAAAVAVADRAGGVAQFTDARVGDPALAEFTRRVTLDSDETLQPHQVRVALHARDEREFSHFIPAQKGDSRNPLSRDELTAKFLANAMTVLSPAQANTLATMIENLESMTDVAELTRLCTPNP